MHMTRKHHLPPMTNLSPFILKPSYCLVPEAPGTEPWIDTVYATRSLAMEP